MKKLIVLSLSILLLSAASYAQNYIGMSKDLVIHQLKSAHNFGKYELDQLDDLEIIKYASKDLKTRKVIFLDKNARCSKFIVIHNDYSILKNVKRELNQNYDKEAKNTWIQRGINDYMWQLDKKQTFFALVVTKSGGDKVSINNR
jgi:hypothetical protein